MASGKQYSDDGSWWWDGQRWLPSTPEEIAAQSRRRGEAITSPSTVGQSLGLAPNQQQRLTNAVILAVAGLIVCLPVGLLFTWLTSWTRRTKAIVTVVGVVVWGVLLTASAISAPPKPTATPNKATATSPSAHPSAASAGPCSTMPNEHVYSPDRLQTLAACVSVTGTIDLVSAEADGDDHIRLKLDADQTCGGQPCTNSKNASDQGGDLLLEPVCEHPVTQADATAACEGYKNSLVVPAVGSHVKATGPFVLDRDHGWLEIHPLESITLLPAPSPSPSPSPSPIPSPSPSPAAAPPPSAPATLTVTITTSTYGYIAAQTLAGATCTAKVRLPSGNYSQAQGLQVTETAGADGSVSWSYDTTSRTTKGTGTSFVTCNFNGKTVTASAPFLVS